jgi:hypothetical protein
VSRAVKPYRAHHIITIETSHLRPILQFQTRYILDRRVLAWRLGATLQTRDRLFLCGALHVYERDVGDLEKGGVAVARSVGVRYALRKAQRQCDVVYLDVGEEDVFDICLKINKCSTVEKGLTNGQVHHLLYSEDIRPVDRSMSSETLHGPCS